MHCSLGCSNCKTAVVLMSSSVLDYVRHVPIAMTDLCSFWRWVHADCWSHPCCIVLQLPGPVPTSRRWRMRSGIWSQRKRCRPTCCQLRGKSSCNWRWMPGRHSVMLRRGHSVQRQRLTSIAMRVSGPSARRLDFVCMGLTVFCCLIPSATSLKMR